MQKQPEARARTRKKILDTFFDLYRDRPLREITVSLLSKRAEINRGTFYAYFDDVYDLWDQAAGDLLAVMEANASTAVTCSLAELAPIGVAFLEEHGDRFALLLSRGDGGFSARLLGAMKPYVLEKLGVEALDGRTDLMLSFLLAGVTGALTAWYQAGKPLDTEEVVQELQGILWRCLGER